MANLKKLLTEYKKVIAIIAGILVIPAMAFAARTSVDWVNQSGTTYIQPNFGINGMDLLILGSNHYINFNAVTGTNGYGIRDNAGTMEFKNSGGAWAGIGSGSGGGGGGAGTFSTTTSQVPTINTNHPTVNTDVVTIGSFSTTTAPFYFDPNLGQSFLKYASSTGISVSGTASTSNLTVSSVPNALFLGGTAGAVSAFAGSNCSAGNAPTGINANGSVNGCTAYQASGTYLTTLGNYGSTTAAAVSFSTTTATVNGLTYGLTIVPSASALLFTPTVTGTYTGQAGSVANAATFNNGGSGTASGGTFNGSAAVTISYNTLGAVPTTRNVTVAGTANQITSSAGAQDLSADRTWTLSFPALIVQPNASTTLFSNFKTAYFGGTSTTTIDVAGNIVIPSGAGLTNTGRTDGCATWSSGGIISTGLACGTGGTGIPWMFVSLNNYGTSTVSTTTSITTQGVFFASSTVAASQFPLASSTRFSTTYLNVGPTLFDGSNGVGLQVTDTVDNALWFNAGSGTFNIQAGSSASNKYAQLSTSLMTSNKTFNFPNSSGTLCVDTLCDTFGKSWEVDAALQLAPTTTLAVSIPTWLSINDALFTYGSTTNGTTILGLSAAANSSATTSVTQTFLTAIGNQAAQANTTSGLRNTALGYQALAAITAGDDSTAIGYQALAAMGSGLTNSFGATAVGSKALAAYNPGAGQPRVTAVGYGALQSMTSGNQAVAVGDLAGNNNTNAQNSVIIGASAGSGGSSFTAKGNTIIGSFAGSAQSGSSDNNVFVGFQSGGSVTSGYGNVLLGAYESGVPGNLTTGGNNIAVGESVFFASTTANNQLNIGNLLFGTIPATTTAFQFPISGTFGVATATPFGKFAIQLNNGDTSFYNNAFIIASSTSGATTTLFSVDNTGAASTTKLFGAQLSSCSGTSFLQWTSGSFSCTAAPAGGSGAQSSTTVQFIIYPSDQTSNPATYFSYNATSTQVVSNTNFQTLLKNDMSAIGAGGSYSGTAKGTGPGGAIFLTPGTFYSNATTTCNGNDVSSTNNAPRCEVYGAGQEATKVIVVGGSDFLNFDHSAIPSVHDMSIYTTGFEKAIVATSSNPNVRSIWQFDFHNLNIESTTTFATTTAFYLGNVLRGQIYNIETFGQNNNFWFYAEGNFNVGGVAISRSFMDFGNAATSTAFKFTQQSTGFVNEINGYYNEAIGRSTGATYIDSTGLAFSHFNDSDAEQMDVIVDGKAGTVSNQFDFQYSIDRTGGANMRGCRFWGGSYDNQCNFQNGNNDASVAIIDDMNSNTDFPNRISGSITQSAGTGSASSTAVANYQIINFHGSGTFDTNFKPDTDWAGYQIWSKVVAKSYKSFLSGANAASGLFVNIDTSIATNVGVFVQDNTNFAHSGDLLRLVFRNGSDTGNAIDIQNLGTGASINATSSRGTDFIVIGGKTGIATTTPAAALGVQGNEFIAGNIVSTSTLASIFPYASTTAMTVTSIFTSLTSSLVSSVNGLISSLTLSAGFSLSANTLSNVTYHSFTYATSTAWAGTTTVPMESAYGETWNQVRCFTDAGTVNVDFYHSTNHLNFLLGASTTNGIVAFSSNNTMTSGDQTKVDIGTPASSPTKINCTVKSTL